MKIEDILREPCVLDDLKGKTKRDVLVELVEALRKEDFVENVDRAVHVILEREKLGSTGIGEGVAIPHGKIKGLKNILCAFGRSEDGVDFDAIDMKPVHILFLLLAPEDSATLHLKMLSRISKILRDQSFRKNLMEYRNSHEIYTGIIEEDRKI